LIRAVTAAVPAFLILPALIRAEQHAAWLERRVQRAQDATLKPRGVLFSSNPRGQNEEGWNRGRYGAYHDLETWRRYLSAAGFEEIGHYYRPAGLPCDQQPWLAVIARRT